MELFLNIVSAFFIISGIFFFTVGVVGLIRMPDVFSRLHATTKADTLGAGLVVVGLAIQTGFSRVTVGLFMVLAFVWLTNPTAAHTFAKAQYTRKHMGESDD